MILNRLTVRDWREIPLQELEFSEGLNVVVGPNEAGKSTVLEALRFAFFERPDTKRAVAAAIRSKGRALTPTVSAEFKIGDQVYRLQKRFLENREHTLLERLERGAWCRLSQDRDALGQIELLLQSDGALDYGKALWSEQGGLLGPFSPPAEMKDRLSQTLSGLLITDLDRQVLENTITECDQRLTPGRKQPKTGSQLKKAIDDCEQAEALLQQVENKLGQHKDRLRRLGELHQEGAKLREQLDKCKAGLESSRKAKAAWDACRALIAQAAAHRVRAKQLISTRQDWRRVIDDLTGDEKRITEDQALLSTSEKALTQALKELETLSGTEKDLERDRNQLSQNLECVGTLRALRVSNSIIGLRNTMPQAPEDQQMRDFAKLRAQVDKLDTQLKATGIKIRLTPKVSISGRVRLDGEEGHRYSGTTDKSVEWTAAQAFLLEIDDVAMIEARTGMEAAAKQKAELERLVRASVEALGQFIPGKLPQMPEHLSPLWSEIEERFQKAQQVRMEIQKLEAQLSVLGQRVRHEELAARVEELKTKVVLDQEVENLDEAHLAAIHETLSSRLSRSDLELAGARHSFDKARRDKEALENRHAQVRESFAGAKATKRTHLTELDRVREKARSVDPSLAPYSDVPWQEDKPFDRAVEDSSELFTKLTEAAARASAEASKMEEEADRGRPLGQEVTADDLAEQEKKQVSLETGLRDVENERHEVSALVKDGADGLGDELNRCYEELALRRAEKASLEIEAKAWDLLRTTLQEEEHVVLGGVIKPISDRVAPWVQNLTGRPCESVDYSHKDLNPRALSRDGLKFDIESEISYGTREQLAFLTRLALASFLASKGSKQLIVLDDPFVNSDLDREARAWAILLQCQDCLQAIVATCRPFPESTLSGIRVTRLK